MKTKLCKLKQDSTDDPFHFSLYEAYPSTIEGYQDNVAQIGSNAMGGALVSPSSAATGTLNVNTSIGMPSLGSSITIGSSGNYLVSSGATTAWLPTVNINWDGSIGYGYHNNGFISKAESIGWLAVKEEAVVTKDDNEPGVYIEEEIEEYILYPFTPATLHSIANNNDGLCWLEMVDPNICPKCDNSEFDAIIDNCKLQCSECGTITQKKDHIGKTKEHLYILHLYKDPNPKSLEDNTIPIP